ncbi:hypothetical protein [Protaetiibacter intestinalis]|uniref:Uncharacterized protein n=1 Tax=Protaetiibacter intestinalis TaxID=2419774 RepID=A0A387B358_9MICO|nr:hypothetical protein [Protaetiibacter intestinalis]AYF98034.1 hypothetical protein D7I47_07055 [Protaetiibacter intestinalis]
MPLRRLVVTAAALALAAGLAGCASVDDALADAADAGVAAAGSSVLALELHADGAAPAPLTDTVLADAIAELTDASRGVLELTPGDPDAEANRDAVEAALRDALDAVVGARAALGRGEATGGWADRLAAARAALVEAAP